ncbi:N-acetylglucosaminidase, partial [Clostridium intestinale]
GMSRPDVRNAYPEYINSDKSGYEYDINTTSIPAGTQNIKVQAIGNDGTIQESTSIVNLEKRAAYTWLDEPIINSPINGNIKVRGWAVNASGVKEVKIYVNKTYIGSANIGISRSDVGKVYPEYINSSNSGYEYTVDVSNIAPGIKELSIQSIGNDGSSQTYTSNVNIIKPTPKTYIDEPTINSSVNNDLKIRGWAVNASTIKEIKLYLDNNYVGSTGVGLPRLDVGKAYPEYRNAGISGYEYTIDTSSLNQGIKTIKVQAIGYDGTLDETTVKINIVHSTTTYIPYPKSFNSYVDIQMEKKPLIQDRTAWREATKDEISYYMNPLNFVNDSYGKYMFLKLTYSEGIQAYQLNNVLKGKGVLDGKGQAFIEAGRRANVNPIYLVAHALLETGNGTSALAGGEITVDKIHEEFGNVKSQSKTVEPRVIFNMYGVGALDKDANLWGSEKAYSEGWFTVEDAIIGGAKWIGDGYINSTTYNQNTLYKMRWDFSTSSMWHQYATDIEWAYKQTVRIKSIIDSMDNPVIHFEIPIFN